jgi:Protein of unknown function (DUF3617)
MNRYLLIVPLAILAACGSGDTVEMTNASAGEVAKEMGKTDVAFVNPGKWQQNATLVDIEAPGIPPEYAEAIKKSVGTSQLHETCLTPEQARQPKEDFFAGAEKNCRYEHFKWGGGKVDMKLVCNEAKATRTMELTGTYEPNSYQMAMAMTGTGDGPGETMTMKMKVDAKRVGECSGREG